MIIDQVFPKTVGGRSSLRERLITEALGQGLSDERSNLIVSVVPEMLLSSGCFLDRMTNLWRYEFGPYDLTKVLVWGSDMWVPVSHLLAALSSACSRLPEDDLVIYLGRLANPESHQDALAEMMPAHRVGPNVPMKFEVAGLGVGNRRIDWVIEPEAKRLVLLDVKRRVTDFIKQAERISDGGAEPVPDHDPALLFRSVAQKFLTANPDLHIQGVWISTNIKQNEERLARTFAELDPDKVHFAVFDDWEPDLHVLTRRENDRQYLFNLFRARPSSRFTFVGKQ
jgi:hypothetical protein